MAFPQVAAVHGGNEATSVTDHTVNLPAGINAGDLLLVFFVADGTPTITFPAGWTQLFVEDAAGGAPSAKFGCWYRIAEGGEGATIAVTTSVVEASAHTSYRVTGYSGTPEVGTATEGTSVNPDPPSLTPTWGAKDTLWFACYGADRDRFITNYPTNYGNGRWDGAEEVWGCSVGTCRRELNAVSENPGAFTITLAQDWAANTVAVQPLAAVPVGGGAGGVTGGAGILLVGA